MSQQRRIATCECIKCHAIVPKTEAKAYDSEKASGRIGWGWSLSQRTDGSNGRRGISSGRTVYRNVTEWICDQCIEDDRVTSNRDTPTFIVFLGLVAFAIAWYEAGLIATLVFLLTTGWGWILTGAFALFVWLAIQGHKEYDAYFNGSDDS